MVSSKAATAEEYLKELPEDRREAISAVRQVILENLPEGYQEGMLYGMLCYSIPLEDYPETYNGKPLMYVALASQKNYMSLYLTNVYGHPDMEQKFEDAYAASGKRMDRGKGCVRFKQLDDLPLDVVAMAIGATPVDEHIRRYEASRARFKGG